MKHAHNFIYTHSDDKEEIDHFRCECGEEEYVGQEFARAAVLRRMNNGG